MQQTPELPAWQGPTTGRRKVLATGGVVVAAAAVTAACGSSNSSGAGSAQSPTSAAPIAPFTVPTADIPVGGGRILAAQKTVITQPTAGKFRAFSAVCTHQGCIVGTVANGVIECPCHGSQFSIVDGTVQRGPAAKALAARMVKVSGASLTVS